MFHSAGAWRSQFRLCSFAVASFLALSFAGAHAASLNSGNDAFSALRDYAELIDPGHQPAADSGQSSNLPRHESTDPTVAALRAFAEQIGANQPGSIKDRLKVAEPKTLMDWLNGKDSSGPAPAAPARPGTPATPPRTPAAKGGSAPAPVDAHFMGSQTCATCHATQVAEFQKTMMGKIGTTQKGKFECENCHGPGSAHVKLGGGRGVGG